MIPLLVTASTAALANGQSTHLWISGHALEHLPSGELRDLLTRLELQPMLLNGTMFPDGGYPQSVPYARDYAETAHWEPFQTAYLEWITTAYTAPWSDEAAQHIAFLMGLASHGMADQTFDAFYFDWSRHYDAEHGWAAGESFDEASDVVWCSLHGPQPIPEEWVPYDVLVDLYGPFGIPVERETLETGHTLLQLAVGAVGVLSGIPETVAAYQADFPWGGAHLDDPTLPGTPTCEGEIVARYWLELWERIQGTTEDTPHAMVMATWPPAGQPWGIGTAADQPTSRVSVVFARSLAVGDVTPDRFRVEDAAGSRYEVSPWLFYGTDSHIVHLEPVEDWPDDTDFTVTVESGLPFTDGRVLSAPFVFAFSTSPGPPPTADPPAAAPGTCGCAASTVGPGWLWAAALAPWLRRRGR
jgi:Zinc dependent phospholipase C